MDSSLKAAEQNDVLRYKVTILSKKNLKIKKLQNFPILGKQISQVRDYIFFYIFLFFHKLDKIWKKRSELVFFL